MKPADKLLREALKNIGYLSPATLLSVDLSRNS